LIGLRVQALTILAIQFAVVHQVLQRFLASLPKPGKRVRRADGDFPGGIEEMIFQQSHVRQAGRCFHWIGLQDAFQVLDGTAGGILRQRGIRGDNQHQRLIAEFFRPFSQVLNFRHHQVPGNQVAHQDDSRIFRRIIPFNGPLAGHHGMEGFTDRHIIVFPLIANPVGNGLVELAYIHVGKRHPPCQNCRAIPLGN